MARGMKRARSISTRGEARGTRPRNIRNAATALAAVLVGGEKLVETAFAFMRFVPSGARRVGIRAILLSVVPYR